MLKLNRNIAHNVYHARRGMGYHGYDTLAAHAEVSCATLKKVESGEGMIRQNTADRIAEALRVPWNVLRLHPDQGHFQIDAVSAERQREQRLLARTLTPAQRPRPQGTWITRWYKRWQTVKKAIKLAPWTKPQPAPTQRR